MKRPCQDPIQAGSLTTNVTEQSDTLTRGDKVSEGKLFAPIDESSCEQRNHHKGTKGRATLNPSNWQGKDTDRRETNYASLVKVAQSRNGWTGGKKGRAVVLLAKSAIAGEAMGRRTQRPSRGKSRRYVTNNIHNLSNWRDPDGYPQEKDKGRDKACRLKLLLKPGRESEMPIVAIRQRDSKPFWSEGALAFSSLPEGGSV